jgi:hypothetical protein
MFNGRLGEYFVSFFSDSKKMMRLAFILGMAFVIVSTVFINAYANDAGLYIAMIHAFAIGDWNRAFLDSIPPFFPVAAGLICKLGFTPWSAAALVSGVFYVLAIFPLYGTLCFFMDKKYAAWGVLFYILAPKIMRWGLAPLTDGCRLFFFMLPVYFMFSFYRNKKMSSLVWLGIALALLALVRGEGILFAPVIVFALLLLCFKDNGYKITAVFFRKAILYCLVTLFVALAVMSPRIFQVYQKTGVPAMDARVANQFKRYYGKLHAVDRQSSAEYDVATYAFTNSASAVPLKVIDKRDRLSVKYMVDFLQNIVRGSYEVYFALAALGMILLLAGRQWTLEYGLLIFFTAMNAAMFYFFSIPYRYFIVNVMLLMPFTMLGFKQTLAWAVRFRVVKLLIAGMCVLSVSQAVNGLDNSIDRSKIYWHKIGDLLKQRELKKADGSGNFKTVYILGVDCGTNLFNDFNVINPDRTGIVLNVNDARKGFPASLCLAVAQKTPDDKILKPDFMLIAGEYQDEITGLRNDPGIREVPTPWSKKVVLFESLK